MMANLHNTIRLHVGSGAGRNTVSVFQPWLRHFDRNVLKRSLAMSVAVGSTLTFAGQFGAVSGTEPVKILPLVLSFATPFIVASASQLAGIRV
jgi:hypothetical protein